MATHSSILAWIILRTEEPGGHSPWGCKESDKTERLILSSCYSPSQGVGHLMGRVDSLEKDPDAGRDWGQEEKGMTEDEMAGWHHRLDGHGFG